MNVSKLALVQGMDDTRATLRRWEAAPLAALLPWAALSLAITLSLLGAVLVVGLSMTPDLSRLLIPGLTEPASPRGAAIVLARNSLVLALHALACVAGFIAGSSLPLQAAHHRGFIRALHDHAGRAAIAFVTAATLFSLATQAYILGSIAATLALQLQVSLPVLMLTLLPHALIELVALFLPLAAWIIASRRGLWSELLAATAVTTVIAVPMLVLASGIEVLLWPELMRAVSPIA